MICLCMISAGVYILYLLYYYYFIIILFHNRQLKALILTFKDIKITEFLE